MSTSSHAEALATRSWARSLVEEFGDDSPLDLVASVALSVAQAIEAARSTEAAPHGATAADPGVSTPLAARLFTGEAPNPPSAVSTEPSAAPNRLGDAPLPPGGWADVWLPGVVHEQAVSTEDRSARGAWYTPRSVVRGLVALATADDRVPVFAADPTCGGGAFLLAALDRMVALGLEPGAAVARVAGLDIDAGAATVSRWSVVLWAAANGVSIEADEVDVSVGDALAGNPSHWPDGGLLVGNPPFATPLRTGAVPPAVESFRQGREDLLGPYTDLAAMHLLAAVENRGPGSVVALVQPQSVLSGRDTGAIREHSARHAPVHSLWAAREPVFDAGVRACAAVLRPGSAPPRTVVLASGPDVVEVGVEPYRGSSWSGYAARALGAPTLPRHLVDRSAAGFTATVETEPGASPTANQDLRLGSIATATAGFRDEYYGLVAACSEWQGEDGGEPNRLLTVGSVEPLATKWGAEPCRFGRKRWTRPCIDIEQLDRKVRQWTDRQSQPKVVLATQSPILEPVIDRTGALVPATPLIAVHASADDLSRIAAVLLAPPVVAWAWQQWFGAALAVDALKLAARQVLELPLPPDGDLWGSAAALIDEAEPASVAEGWTLACEVATIMNRAYQAEEAVLTWWFGRAGSRPVPPL